MASKLSSTKNTRAAAAATPCRLDHLASEVLANILHYLPPSEMESCCSAAVAPFSSSSEIVEYAAWLGLQFQWDIATKWCKENFPTAAATCNGATSTSSSSSSSSLVKYSNESYLDLYKFFYESYNRLIYPHMGVVSKHKRGLYSHAILYVLLGAPDIPVGRIDNHNGAVAVSNNSSPSAVIEELLEKVQRVTKNIPFVYCEMDKMLLVPLRRIQIAMRTGDAGEWSLASTILRLTLDDPPPSKTVVENENATTTAMEERIFTCKWKIDRMYSNTYVDASGEDSKDTIEAVTSGRVAVQWSLQMLMASESAVESFIKTEWNPTPSSSSTAGSARQSKQQQQQQQQHRSPPTAIQSLFSSPSVRLAAARLQLARALASLAQMVGLECTDIEVYRVPPLVVKIVEENTNNNEEENFVLVAQSYFEEGLQVIQKSLCEIEEGISRQQQQQKNSSRILEDLLEMKAATIAARGELLYCAASTHPLVTIRHYQSGENSSNGNTATTNADRLMSLEAMLEKSIQSLKQSFVLVGEDLASSRRGIGISVSAWCAKAQPSLLRLQCQTAKDLGKVLHYAAEQTTNDTMEEARQYQMFAFAVSKRMNRKDHPSTANICRLLSHFGLREADLNKLDEIERDVNEWLKELLQGSD